MRWTRKGYQPGDARTKTGFLFLPLCVNDEWRWLERATWGEVLVVEDDGTREHRYWDRTEWRQT